MTTASDLLRPAAWRALIADDLEWDRHRRGRASRRADLARVRALADLCVVIFNTHEFVYIP